MAAYTTIDNPEQYFQIVLYTGNGSNRTISYPNADADLDADMIWIKQRSDATSHTIFDTVRGAQEAIFTNNANAETTRTDAVSAFGTDGFDLGANGDLNANTETHVAWCWKESATAGFDIVSYTGTGSAHTISHSLSAVPDVMIMKGRSFSDGWIPYFKTSGNPIILALDDTVADRYSSRWSPFFNSTAPTSSVFTVGTDSAINTSSGTHIAYLWSAKQGFSKFGQYTANSNSSDFIYTGFKPAWLMVKQTDSGGNQNWGMFDNKRAGYNTANAFLYANSSADEDASNATTIDLLSNGFQLRANTVGSNPTKSYIYMAFAEAPFVNSNGVPGNAR